MLQKRQGSLLQSLWYLSLVICEENLERLSIPCLQGTENLAENGLNNKRFRFIVSLSGSGVFPWDSAAQPHHKGLVPFHFLALLFSMYGLISSGLAPDNHKKATSVPGITSSHLHTLLSRVEKRDHTFLNGFLFIGKSFPKTPPKDFSYAVTGQNCSKWPVQIGLD